MKKLLSIVFLSLLAGACSAPEQKPAEKPVETKPATEAPKTDGTPAEIRAAFPDASTITAQKSRAKGGDEFTSYVAFAMKDGKKTTLGVATLVPAEGVTYLLAVNNNVDITQVSVVKSGGKAEVESADFLKQFSGKTHDDAFKIGKDLKFAGTDKATAEKVVKALQDAELNLQNIYGKPHTH